MESSSQSDVRIRSERPQVQPRGFYQCGVCKKEYTRADHLIRHVRSHTADKPFRCRDCQKGFARIDLLRRHAQGHRSKNDSDGKTLSSGIRGRVSQACKSCASSKLKCDDEKPCQRCVQRNQLCQWIPMDCSLGEMQATESEVLAGHGPEREQKETSPKTIPSQSARELGEGASAPSNAAPEAPPEEMAIANATGEEISRLLEYGDYGQGMADPSTFFLTNPDDWNIIEELDFDFGFIGADLELQDSLTRPSPYLHASNQTNQLDLNASSKAPNEENTDDLDQSPLSNWTPCADDNAYMDQQYLSIPAHLDTPISPHVVRDRSFTERLSKESRDAVFAVVVATCQGKGPPRIMKCFPGAELLDSLIQDCFKHQRSEVDAFIHDSTMQLNQESPEMILTLAAAGAVLSSAEPIQKLGYALMDIARLLVNSKYEDNNVLTRDLKQQQQYILILQIGLWSGDKRRVEIAESFAQPIVTMLRRGSRFKHEAYPTITPDAADDDNIINRKWHEWVEHESFKRLVYHVFHHDVQASLLRSTNPLISYSELDLPIPFSRKLWAAKTATEWKSIYLHQIPTASVPIPSLVTTTQDLSILSRFPVQGDCQLAALSTVHAISTMITDCNQPLRGPSGQWREVVMKIWQQELQKVLEEFDIFAVEPLQEKTPAIALIYLMVSLSLYMPPEATKIFAGRDGQKRSTDTYQSVLQHISPANLRRAGWHAGQVLRIARSMPTSSFSTFCTTCLYLAALTSWTLSTLLSTRYLVQDVGLNQTETVFLLDVEPGESDGAALQRFIISGQGLPTFTSLSKNVPLNDRAGVMRVFQEVLESKHRGGCSHQQMRALHHILAVLGGQKRRRPLSVGGVP